MNWIEALTEGVLQSAFNNFAKLIVKHLCWSLFLISCRLDDVQLYKEKKLWQRFFPASLLFKKTTLQSMSERMLEWYEPKKLHSQNLFTGNTGDGVLFSAVADMCTWSFPKWTTSQMIFQENCEVSQNINFTEQCCSTA